MRKLQEDPDSRQAKITFWDPILDNLPGKRDYPCTSELRFLIRDGKLIVSATMRSNDAWLGLAYDAFQFTQMQISIARALGVGVGMYHHHVCSLHVYERDLDAIERLHIPKTPPSIMYMGIGRDGDSISTITGRARRIACGDRIDDPTQTETAYMKALV
jgi:thymidylate synthase